MERVDIVVTGLDPARPRTLVIAALAEKLARTVPEIELLLEIAPAPLLRAVSIEQAEQLVRELSTLGARVKQRAEVPEVPASAPSGPSAVADAAVSSPVPAAAPTLPSVPAARAGDLGVVAATTEKRDAPPPIIVRESADWFGGASTAPPGPAPLPAPPLAAGRRSLSPARFGRSETAPRIRPGAPRAFFRDLPRALVLPLRGPMLRAQLLAMLLAGTTLGLGFLGLNSDLVFGSLFVALAATAAAGWVGLVHQIGASCLGAAASGDAEGLALPDRLMEDYLRPGLFIGLALGALGTLAVRGADELLRMRATPLTMALYWAPIAAYTTIAFTLASSNRSVLAYVDVAHVMAITRRAPLQTLVIVLLGGIPIAGCLAAIGACFAVSASALSWMTMALNLGVLAPLAAVGLGYALGMTAAAMGLLLSTRRVEV